MKRIILALILSLPLLSSCGIYSFSGTSIHSDTKTICIPYVEYKALRVNPSLSNDMTEALQDKFRKLTSLEQVDMDGDLELVCEITGYDVQATAVTADEVAAELVKRLDCGLVQKIGRVIVLYRPSKKHPTIKI